MVNVPRLSSTLSLVIRGIWKSSIRVLVFRCSWAGAYTPAGAPRRAPRGKTGLLGVQLDDQLLLHGRGHLAALGLAQDLGRQGVVIGLEPGGDLAGQLGGVADHVLGRRIGLDRDHVALAHLVARDVDPAAVDGPVAVADELAGLAARRGEAKAHEDVVQAGLQQREQVLARDAGLARSLVVVGAELLLEHPVVAAGLLLLAQLDAVLGLLLAAAGVLARRGGATFDAPIVGEAALALEEQLLPLATALLALRTGISSHARPLRPGAACGGGSRCALAGSRP